MAGEVNYENVILLAMGRYLIIYKIKSLLNHKPYGYPDLVGGFQGFGKWGTELSDYFCHAVIYRAIKGQAKIADRRGGKKGEKNLFLNCGYFYDFFPAGGELF